MSLLTRLTTESKLAQVRNLKQRPTSLLIALVVLLLASCTPPPPVENEPPATGSDSASATASDSAAPASEGDELNVWITWGDNPQQIQELFDKYTEETGIKVIVNAPVEDPKVIAGLSGNQPPDLLITGGPDNVGTWARESLLTSLDDLVQTGKVDLADIAEGAKGQCVYQGHSYCLPWGTDVYALFWNKDLFEEAGLDPDTPPATMEELANYAAKLTKVDDSGALTQIGFIPDFSWSHLDLYTTMMGGFWYSPDGTQVTLTSDPVVNALKWEQQFYCDNNADEVARFSSSFGGYASPDDGFYAGKIAMMVDGEWQPGPNFIQKYKPELFYDVAPFPAPSAMPENARSTMVTGSVAMIPAGAKNIDASFDLLAWIMKPEILGEEMVANFNLPTSAKAADDPRFQDNEKFGVFLDLMHDPNAKSPVLTPINAEVSEALGQVEEQVLRQCADPLPLLQEAQDKLQPQLDAALEK